MFLFTGPFFLFMREMSRRINYKRGSYQDEDINTLHATRCIRACRVRARPRFFSIYFPVSFRGAFLQPLAGRHLYRHRYTSSMHLLVTTALLINPFNANGIARRVAQFMRIHFTCAPDFAVFLVIPYCRWGQVPRERMQGVLSMIKIN